MLHFQAMFVLDTSYRVSRCRLFLSALLTLVGGAYSLGQDVPSGEIANPLSFPITDYVPGVNDSRNVVVPDGIQAVIDSNLNSTAEQPGLRIASRSLDRVDRETAAVERDKIFRDLSESMLHLQAQSSILRKIVQAVRPSVVHVIADKKPQIDMADLGPGDQFELPPDALVEEAGSGVIVEIDEKVYVLTNRHVIKNAELHHIRISLANRCTLKPTKMWSDESTDVAVLSIEETNVLPAKIGDSDQVEMGDFVLAIGSPFGLSHSVTHGIISAKGRRDLTLGTEKVRIQDFLQTDAAINPGNSGGPLINMRGELIGLNAAIASNSGGNEGIGFSIPINLSLHVARQLILNGHLARVYLGVKLDKDFEPREALELGLPIAAGTRVSDVAKGSPADAANLRRGDIILTFNDVHVENDSHLVKLVGLSSVGTEVPLGVFRDGTYTTTTVKIQERDK